MNDDRTLERELAQAREAALEEAIKSFENYSERGPDSAGWNCKDYANCIRALKTRAAQPAETSAAAEYRKMADDAQHGIAPGEPSIGKILDAAIERGSAVPDDPLAYWSSLMTGCTIGQAIKQLAAHYEHRGMMKAAEICERMQILRDDAWLTQSLPDTSPAACYRAITAAASEVQRG